MKQTRALVWVWVHQGGGTWGEGAGSATRGPRRARPRLLCAVGCLL